MGKARRALVIGLGLAWGILVTGGALALTANAGRGSVAEKVPASWVENPYVTRASDRATVLVFVHPRCPCSRATLRELERDLVSGAPSEVHVFFVQPRGAAAGFEQGPLWDQATSIKGVKVHVDAGGAFAAQLGAVLSGHVLVFAPNGARTFSGGITPARAHEGESAARQAFVAALSNDSRQLVTTTFGCPLENKK
jgi:hypothetical protein